MIAGREDLSTWREHPVTKALRAVMTQRIGTYLRAIPQHIISDDHAKMRAAAGALNAYEELYDELFTDEPVRPVEDPGPEYRDPAARTKEP